MLQQAQDGASRLRCDALVQHICTLPPPISHLCTAARDRTFYAEREQESDPAEAATRQQAASVRTRRARRVRQHRAAGGRGSADCAGAYTTRATVAAAAAATSAAKRGDTPTRAGGRAFRLRAAPFCAVRLHAARRDATARLHDATAPSAYDHSSGAWPATFSRAARRTAGAAPTAVTNVLCYASQSHALSAAPFLALPAATSGTLRQLAAIWHASHDGIRPSGLLVSLTTTWRAPQYQ